MKNFSALLLIPIVIIASINWVGCKSDQKPETLYSQYVNAFTSGIISNSSPIQIVLSQPVGGIEPGSPIDGKLLRISPSVDGQLYWKDASTIIFKPDRLFKSDTEYGVNIKLGQIFNGSDDFNFSFRTFKQGVRVTDSYLESVSADLKDNVYNISLITADFINATDIESSVVAEKDGKKLTIEWDHAEMDKSHRLVVKGVTRNDKSGELKLQFKDQLAASVEFSRYTFDVPAVNRFCIMEVKPVLYPDQYLQVTFSDPLRKGQNLAGLITIADAGDLRYEVDKSRVRIYPSMRITGTRRASVNQGILNSNDIPLKEDNNFDITFENLKPKVTLLTNGNIIPGSSDIVLPFKAVSLKAVEVRIIKLFENNIPSFLQTNTLSSDGLYELRRAGRLIVKKTIRLDEDVAVDLSKWNTFSLNLTDLIKTEPGAIYRVTFNFAKKHAFYPCMNSDGEPDTPLVYDDEAELKEEQGVWDSPNRYLSYWDYYYDEDYDWYQRDNPCNSSYYSDVQVGVNILSSDLGLIAKQGSDNKIVASVASIATTRPIPGVTIEVLSYQNQLLGSGKTGSDGMVTIPVDGVPYLLLAKKDKERGYMRLDPGNSLSLSRFDVQGQTMQKGMKGFIYGERGVWRPGDSLFVSFILENYGEKLPAAHPVTFELVNPQGRTDIKLVQPIGNANIIAFRTATADDAVTGTYTARVIVGGAKFEKPLKIETIKPNRLKIDLNFSQKVLSYGKQSPGVLKAKWLHGATARNLKAVVTATLSKGSTSFKGYDGYVFDDPTRTFYGDELVVFDGKLNESGEVTINPEISVKNAAPGMLNASFYTRIFEEGGDFSLDRFTMPYAPYRSFVGIRTPQGDRRGMLLTDTNHTVDVVTVNPQGEPISVSALTYEVYKVSWRWWWESDDNELGYYRGSQSKNLVASGKLNTVNGKGSFQFMVKYPEWGRYLVRVVDEAGEHSSAKAVYVDWPGWALKPMGDDLQASQMLSFSLDKDNYKVGEKVKLTFPSAEGGRALVSIENGHNVISSYWVDTKKEMTSFSFETTKEMTPNVYVNITMLQPHAQSLNNMPIRMYGVMPVLVEDPSTHLVPVISMDDELRPEQTAKVKVSEKNGTPMSYTLAVVDEGLLDITRFKTPNPWTHFFAREALGVKTWDLYNYVMGAYGGRIERAFAIGGDAELDGKKSDGKQNRFKPVVRFYGPFTLSKGKTATHNVDIPRYIGSVKVMVVASSEKAYGNAEKAVPVRSPLMVQSTLPRVCGPNETINVPVTVFSLSKKSQNVEVSITNHSGFTVEGDKKITVEVQAESEKVVYFKLKADDKPGNGVVAISAKSGSDKADDETFLAIRPSNPATVRIAESMVKPGETIKLNPHHFGIEGTEKITFEASIIPPINLGKRLHYLLNYPHGCAEQTTSAAFPQLYLADLVESPDVFSKTVSQNVTAAIDRIKMLQLSDGGIAYWPGQTVANEWTTSYVGYFLSEAARKGYVIPDGMIKRWADFQNKCVREWNHIKTQSDSDVQQAFRLFVLAQAGYTNLSAMNRMRKMDNLSVMSRWYLAAAYARAGYATEGKEIINSLPAEWSGKDTWATTYGSETRDLAIMIETYNLLKMSDKAFDLVRKISDQLSTDKWMSTQTTAYALLAVSHYLDNNKSSSTFALDVTTDGSKKTLSSQSPFMVKELDASASEVTITNKGDGNVFARITTAGVPVEGQEVSASSNLVMSIVYTDMNGNQVDVESLKQGYDIMATVTVSNPGTVGRADNLALVQIFPSGWEIRNTRLEDNSTHHNNGIDYQDYRDDRVMSYFNLAAGETKRIVTLLHPTYSGRYYLPGVNCQAMYNNNISAAIAGRWVEVVKE